MLSQTGKTIPLVANFEFSRLFRIVFSIRDAFPIGGVFFNLSIRIGNEYLLYSL